MSTKLFNSKCPIRDDHTPPYDHQNWGMLEQYRRGTLNVLFLGRPLICCSRAHAWTMAAIAYLLKHHRIERLRNVTTEGQLVCLLQFPVVDLEAEICPHRCMELDTPLKVDDYDEVFKNGLKPTMKGCALQRWPKCMDPHCKGGGKSLEQTVEHIAAQYNTKLGTLAGFHSNLSAMCYTLCNTCNGAQGSCWANPRRIMTLMNALRQCQVQIDHRRKAQAIIWQ